MRFVMGIVRWLNPEYYRQVNETWKLILALMHGMDGIKPPKGWPFVITVSHHVSDDVLSKAIRDNRVVYMYQGCLLVLCSRNEVNQDKFWSAATTETQEESGTQ